MIDTPRAMSQVEPIHYWSASQLARAIHRRELSVTEVTQYMLERIAGVDGHLRSYVTVAADRAMDAASAADRDIAADNIRSRLHGVPVAVKDLLDTHDMVTTYGMALERDHRPDADATIVERLRAAGAVILGKLKLTEGAYSRHHPDIEAPLNPWNEDCWTGVSSSGSGVATAAGLCFVSIGSDTGGSIRFPSASNGLVGLKPTWGRVSRAGALPLAYTLDHMGPMCRTVADAAATLGIIAGADRRDPTASSRPVPDYTVGLASAVAGMRVGYDETYCGEGVDASVAGAVEEAVDLLGRLGARVVPVTMPAQRELTTGWVNTTAVEALHAHEGTFPQQPDRYGPALRGLLEHGQGVTADAYLTQELARRDHKGSLTRLFDEVDVVVCPTTAYGCLPREGSPDPDMASRDMTIAFTAPFNYSGSPTLSLPWKLGESGVPLSIQLVARDYEERLLLQVGHALEVSNGFERHPTLP